MSAREIVEQSPNMRLLARLARELTVAEYMRNMAQEVIRAGGRLAADSAGRSIYPTRVEFKDPMLLFDPHIRREARVRVRLRLTVEFEPID